MQLDATISALEADPIAGFRAKRFSVDLEGHVAWIEVLVVRQSGAIANSDTESVTDADEYKSLVGAIAADPHGKTLVAWLIEHRADKYGSATLAEAQEIRT